MKGERSAFGLEMGFEFKFRGATLLSSATSMLILGVKTGASSHKFEFEKTDIDRSLKSFVGIDWFLGPLMLVQLLDAQVAVLLDKEEGRVPDLCRVLIPKEAEDIGVWEEFEVVVGGKWFESRESWESKQPGLFKLVLLGLELRLFVVFIFMSRLDLDSC